MSLINKKTLCFPIAFTILYSVNVIAQPPDTLWTRTYGGANYDYGSTILQISEQEFIFTGLAKVSGAETGDVWLLRFNRHGEVVWSKTYGGSNEDGGSAICRTPGGGFLVVGWTRSFEAVGADIFLVKTDTNGDTIWTKTYGGDGEDFALDVCLANDGNFVIVGFTESFGNGNSDIWLLKLNGDGDTLWTKTYGGEGSDEAWDLCTTSDGGYAIAGLTESFGLGGTDLFLLKTDRDGDTVWTRTYGGTRSDKASYIRQNSDGGYLVTGGKTPEDAGQLDLYIVRTDSNGDSIWTKTYGGPGTEEGTSFIQLADGSNIIAGMTSSFGNGEMDVYLIRIDANGDTIWTGTYGGSSWDSGSSILLTYDENYMIGGYTFSFGAGYSDAWILKLGSVTDMEPEINIQLLQTFTLCQNYPNPFNASTTISYTISDPQYVTLTIYDLLGREVRTLIDKREDAGTHRVNLDASELAGGIYFYRLSTGDYSDAKRFTLIK